MKGDVIVSVGEEVSPDSVVAHTHIPGDVKPVNVANILGLPPADIHTSMVKKLGDSVEENEVFAETKSFFGLFKSQVRSPLTGTLESVSDVTGQVHVRGMPIPVEVEAYLRGTIVEVIPEEGVVVETPAAFLQGIFGIGGETYGDLVMATDSPDVELDEQRVKPEQKGKVIAGGSRVTAAALRKAIDLGIRAVVVGGFDDKDLRDFLGYDLGVAITGSEQLGVTLVVTEGFGTITMAQGTFDLLRSNAGRLACVNGATQIRAGVIRPEVVIPLEKAATGPSTEGKEIPGLHEGSQIRVIREPYFGRLARVTDLPAQLTVLPSGSKARVLEVELEGGEKAILPRANVELIER
ncbi:MAG: hypothetical protein O7H41_19050 [Planctomycetota bacterium]|nr:hypothetical protein [Planctomycetota bacterium]